MKVSDSDLRREVENLAPGFFVRIELPNTDALCLISDVSEIDDFIESHGDVEIVFNEALRRFEVPSFAEGRREAIADKAKFCERFGSE